MNEEFNFDPSSIERFREKLEDQFNIAEEQYKQVESYTSSIVHFMTGCGAVKSVLFDTVIFDSKKRLFLLPDVLDPNNSNNNNQNEIGINNLWTTYSKVKNLRRETQNIDKDISTFLESIKDYFETSQKNAYGSTPDILNCCLSSSNNDYFYSELEISMILEIQERNRKLLACLKKLESTLQAVILMWLVHSVKQIPSFAVYLICNLNITLTSWLSSGFGEEMMGDLTERQHELKEEHPNSDILVSLILLGIAFQMLWSLLLIKLDDSMSDEEIEFCF